MEQYRWFFPAGYPVHVLSRTFIKYHRSKICNSFINYELLSRLWSRSWLPWNLRTVRVEPLELTVFSLIQLDLFTLSVILFIITPIPDMTAIINAVILIGSTMFHEYRRYSICNWFCECIVFCSEVCSEYQNKWTMCILRGKRFWETLIIFRCVCNAHIIKIDNFTGS